MGALAKSLLLFALNWIDAQLTLFWVHSNIATEGNGLMNQLLKVGDAPFLLSSWPLELLLPTRCIAVRISRWLAAECSWSWPSTQF